MRTHFTNLFIIVLALVISSVAIAGQACTVADNGTGTVTLPPLGCQFTSPNEVFMIIDGLPPGTTIELDGVLMDMICCSPECQNCSMSLAPGECETYGGSLGGNGHCFSATLYLAVSGTGELEGFNRNLLAVPVFCEVHTGPRNPGEPVQIFPSDMYRLQGELFGDPDFCTFRIIGGTDYGLPGPGQTTLTQLPSGDFAVDSFFDITYQIEFEGCPGSVLEGFMGITLATIRMETGFVPECAPKPDGSGCLSVECQETGAICQPKCVRYDPATGITTVIECECSPRSECQPEIPQPDPDDCIQPDNGTGTITLPPIGCDFISPDEVFMIIDGLPAGTTIEMDPIHKDFICCGDNCYGCSVSMASGQCETPGGSLGGHIDCFDSTLDLTVSGTGVLEGFNRHLAVPVFCEVHTGPRNPGDPVQIFANDMYRLQGELFGDPDFCTFRIIGGTDFGLPGPGQTTLTQLPSGDFAVDSFFDITYQIEFEGCPGSVLDGYSGITTATIRMKTGSDNLGVPSCVGACDDCDFCFKTTTVNPDGTIDICCECIPDADLNRDGIVDLVDFNIFARQWLSTRPQL